MLSQISRGTALSVIPAKAGIQGWWGNFRRGHLPMWDRFQDAGSIQVCTPFVVQFLSAPWRCPMAKTEMIRARVEPELKRQAEELFSSLGLSTTEAITLFYKQVTLHQGLPFAVRMPNAETIEALEQARDGEGLTEYRSLDELKASLD